jgi:hypothetical protein
LWIIAVIIIGSLVVLGILLLSIPIDLAADFDSLGKPRFTMNWAWFFGLITRDIKFKKRDPKRKKPPRKTGLLKIIGRIRSGSNIILTRGFVVQVLRLVKRIFRRIKIRYLEAEWHIGLDYPDETFYLFVLTEPINRLLNYSLPYPVSIQPSFSGPCFEGHLRVKVRFYPVLLVPLLMQFVFSVPTFRVVRQVVVARWRRK